MRLKFTKMHGLGNDFVVLDAISQRVSLTSVQIRALADRRFGIGCDQVLLVEPPPASDVDFRYRIFNADGNEVEQCGNGARCFARFVREHGLSNKDVIPVATASGKIELRVLEDGQVSVDMGRPQFAPSAIPFEAETQMPSYTLELDGTLVEFGAVSMGNPHAVVRVEEVASAPVAELGARIQNHSRFPHRVNVGFMQVVDRGHIRLRVFERGVGETLACGTGACAAVAIGRKQGVLDERVVVDLPGGQLHIAWEGDAHSVIMTGPATSVFEGQIDI